MRGGPLASFSIVRLGGRIMRADCDLVITVWYCLSGDACEARQSRFGRTNDPYRCAAVASDISLVGVDGVFKPGDHLGALCFRIRTQMQLDVVLQSYRREPSLHVRLVDQNPRLHQSRSGRCSLVNSSRMEELRRALARCIVVSLDSAPSDAP